MEENPWASVRIVIADDIVTMRKILLSMLRYIGYRNIAVAEDGQEAWEIISKEKVDLVISDWNMPRMTGIELLHKVRSTYEYENLPFIMVTGEVDETNVAQAAENDVDSYMLKPFVPKELEEKIKFVLENRNNPSPYQRLLNSAREVGREQKPAQAMAMYKAAIAMEPAKPVAYSFLGQLYEQMGQRDKARATYEKALSLNPRYIRALDGLSRIYSEDGSKKKLLYVLSVLINISPRSAENQFRLGQLAMEVGEKDRARGPLLKATELEPENEERIFEAAKLFLGAELLDEAEKLFDMLLAKSPKNQLYLNCCGQICRKRGKYDKARNYFTTALSIAEDESIHYNLARLYIELGSRRLADYHLEAALILNPDFKDARKLKARVEEMVARVKAARAK